MQNISFMKVLVIEDDKQTAETIRDGMKDYYAVDVALTGEDGEYQASVNDYDAIVLDIVLPGMNGVEVCKKIRENGIKTPILMLTGKVDTKDKVTALDSGADDYLTKPFKFAELLARIRALMRRIPSTLDSTSLSVGDLSLDVSTNKVMYKDKAIPLRRKEFGLLEYLMRNAGQTLTRGMILEHVWDSSTDPITNTVDVHINYLRDKVDRPFGTKLIKTAHGLGYKIEK